MADQLDTLRRLAHEPQFVQFHFAAHLALEAHRQSGEADPGFWLALDSLANELDKSGNEEEVESLLLLSLAIRQKAMGADHLTNAALLEKLSAFNCRLGRYEKAQVYAQDVLSIIDGKLSSQSYDVLKALYVLALICHARGEYGQAESLYCRLLKNLINQEDSADLRLNEVLQLYGQLLQATKRSAEGEYLQALAALDTADVEKISDAIERVIVRRSKQAIG